MITQKVDILKSFQFDPLHLKEMTPWKNVEDGIYYDFGSEGKQIARDKNNIDLLKLYFWVENEKVFPEDVINVFRQSEMKRKSKLP